MDERFLRRPSMYRGFASFAESWAFKNNLPSYGIVFSRSKEIVDEVSPYFDRLFCCESSNLNTPENIETIFQDLSLYDHKEGSFFAFHSPDMERTLLQGLAGSVSRVYLDALEVDTLNGLLAVVSPLLGGRFFKKQMIEDSSLVLFRSFTKDPDICEPKGVRGQLVEVLPIKGKKSVQKPIYAINSDFIITAGSRTFDGKTYNRYIEAIGDKMKGRALPAASLCFDDEDFAGKGALEQSDVPPGAFCVVAGDEGNFDLLDFMMRQEHAVYIQDKGENLLSFAADTVVADPENLFFEEYNSRLKKVSFEPKKIKKNI
jgi:hypothetical protein